MVDRSAAARIPQNRPFILVGRERELAILRQHLAALRTGQGALVLISGDPGIGKTRLIEIAIHEAHADGVFILDGHCYDRTDTPPYGPWIDLFLRYPALPVVPPPPVFADRGLVRATASQLALFAQVHDFFTKLTTQQSTMVVIEDLHWADPASVDLLRFLARSVSMQPLLIVVTYRPAELPLRHPVADLVPLLTHEAHPTRVELRPLVARDVRVLAEASYRLPSEEAARLTAYLQSRSEGNPLFLGELLRTLEEEGILRVTDDSDRLGDPIAIGVPPLLLQVIDGRARRLGDEALALLRWAAVIGHEVPLDLWAAATGASGETILDVMESATRARLLLAAPDGQSVRFAHALVREALYEAILPPRRRQMHQVVAEEVTRSTRPDPDVVGYHFRQAGDPRAAVWLVRAGQRAHAAYAYETAVARFEEALPLLDADASMTTTRAEVLLLLARLLRLEATDPMQSVRYAEAAAAVATALGDEALAAVAQFRRGTNLCLALRSREGLAAMQAASDALDRLPADATDHLVRLDSRSASSWQRQSEYALRLAIVGRFIEAEPQAVAARLEGLRRRDHNSNASNALTHIYPAQARVDDARAMFAECQEQTTGVEEFYHAVLSLTYEIARVVIPFCADQITYRERIAQCAATWRARITGPFADLPLSCILHGLFYLDGRWDEVESTTSGSYGMQQEHAWTRGRVALARGETHAGWRIIRPFLPDHPAAEPGDAWFLGTTAGQRLAASFALAEGDLPTARAWLEAHDRWLDWSGAVLGRAGSAILWARHHRAAGDAENARTSAEQALVLATEPRQPLVLLAVRRMLGELATDAGCLADATAHLRAALSLADACQAPFERALTLVAQAELFVRTADWLKARAVLDDAQALCGPLRATPTLARIDSLAAYIPTHLATSAAPPGLTARQLEVLRLLAEGCSDREIAESLSIGHRTVQTHVTGILAKLGVTSRTAAATYAVRHGVI